MLKYLFCALLLILPISGISAELTQISQDDILRSFLWDEFLQLPKEQRPKIGLALSAGGVRGFAHVGVLEV